MKPPFYDIGETMINESTFKKMTNIAKKKDCKIIIIDLVTNSFRYKIPYYGGELLGEIISENPQEQVSEFIEILGSSMQNIIDHLHDCINSK
jgi:sulfite reductase alpha subunit-like flavoprotein